MSTVEANSDTVMNLSRTFSASRERVFDAWTDPEKVRLWYPPPDFSIPEIELDARPGGVYRLTMTNAKAGIELQLEGKYREVIVPEKLVFTWVWQRPDGTSPETQVTATFIDLGSQTEVRVCHEFFPDKEMRDQHLGGWTACLGQLTGVIA